MFKDKYGINHYHSLLYKGKKPDFVYYPPWDNGIERKIVSKGTAVRNRDQYDPLFDLHCKSGERGITNEATIDGNGILKGRGTAWRIYWYFEDLRRQFYNIDFTMYARIIKSIPGGGATVAIRLGTLSNHFLEHKCESAGTGMYVETKMNKWDQLKKELFHGKSSAVPGYCDDIVLRKNADLAKGKWVGYRNVSIHTKEGLLLIYYKDYTEGKNGGDWRSAGMRLDKGDWGLETEARNYFPKVKQCSSDKVKKVSSPDEIIKSGYANYLRFDNMEMEFKWPSIMELKPTVQPK